MALKNNSDTTKEAYLIRYANPVPDNSGSTLIISENYDRTENSAWGYTPISSTNGADHYGLMIQMLGDPTPLIPFAAEGFAVTAFFPNPCSPAANFASPIINNTGSTVYLYEFPILIKHETVTVNNRYISF